MDWKAILSQEPYGLATSIEECPFHQFWVVLLSNGIEVYQNEPDSSFSDANPWLRLAKFCKDYPNIYIVNMAMADVMDPAKQINLPTSADGYFYSKRARQLFGGGRYDFADHGEGVGCLVDDHLTIYWRNHDGMIEVEHRDIGVVHPKHQGQASLIVTRG